MDFSQNSGITRKMYIILPAAYQGNKFEMIKYYVQEWRMCCTDDFICFV